MKAVGEKVTQTRANAWGRDVTTTHQRFEIEDSDVGREIHHWGGYHYKTLRIAERDVGKVLEQMVDGSGWQCWGFVNN
jgi:hypothetical protein